MSKIQESFFSFFKNLYPRYIIEPAQVKLFSESLVAANDPSSLIAEEYKTLAGRILHKPEFRSSKSIIFTSPQPKDGKSTTVANLGYTLSEKFKKKILLVDGDLRRPQLYKLFGIKNNTGLAEMILTTEMTDLSVKLSENLSILNAGQQRENAGDLLHDISAFSKIINYYSNIFDYILIDTPPILKVLDAAMLAQSASLVFLVIKAQATPEGLVAQSIEQLKNQNITVSGSILVNYQQTVDFYNYVVNQHYRNYYSDIYKGYAYKSHNPTDTKSE